MHNSQSEIHKARVVARTAVALLAGLGFLLSARAQEARPAAGRTVWDGVYSQEQASRGRDAYAESCAACHGRDLRGDGMAPSLIEEGFTFQWDDATVGELVQRTQRLMPLDRPNSLADRTYRDIVAFVLQSNKFPAGEKELDANPEALAQIRITAKQPAKP